MAFIFSDERLKVKVEKKKAVQRMKCMKQSFEGGEMKVKTKKVDGNTEEMKELMELVPRKRITVSPPSGPSKHKELRMST